MKFKSLRDFNLTGQRVLIRADLNVPARRGKISDTTRIDRLKPTIDYLRKAGAKILILSHFGRPEGEQHPEMSLAFLAPTLEQCWDAKVKFCPECIGERAQNMTESMDNGDILILENVRFHKGETANDPTFTAQLAVLGDIYVNDAFSASHRAHASTAGLAALLPSAAGLLMEEELNALTLALETPKKPLLAVTGGSKISTKLNILNNLIEHADYLVLGGAMATTFLHAQGADVGASLCEKDMADEARAIMKNAQDHNCKIILPTDSVAVTEIRTEAPHQIVCSKSIPAEHMAIDVGPKTLEELLNIVKTCKTVLWNGPLGVFEIPPFDHGTNEFARAVADLTQSGQLKSVAGGGDTTAALENAGVVKDFTYVSTAGGAFLEWLKGNPLPGVAALCEDNQKAA